MSDIDQCQSITFQCYLKNGSTFNYDTKAYNNAITFQPDVAIVRAANFMATDSNTTGYRYTSSLLVWSNLTNNYIATLNPVWNPSNVVGAGAITITCNASANPQTMLNLPSKFVPNVLQFAIHQTNNSATAPFDNKILSITTNDAYLQMTIDFIKYKKK